MKLSIKLLLNSLENCEDNIIDANLKANLCVFETEKSKIFSRSRERKMFGIFEGVFI